MGNILLQAHVLPLNMWIHINIQSGPFNPNTCKPKRFLGSICCSTSFFLQQKYIFPFQGRQCPPCAGPITQRVVFYGKSAPHLPMPHDCLRSVTPASSSDNGGENISSMSGTSAFTGLPTSDDNTVQSGGY